MEEKMILIVEDNPDDEALTIRTLKKNNIVNRLVVVRDGVEALDFLFCTGAYSDRDPNDLPQTILLDIKLPKVDGWEVLERIRADERTSLIPVAILTSSHEERDLLQMARGGANSYLSKPVDFNEFMDVARELGLSWLVLNKAPRN
jgi:CheY-like chemotaxis protein